jgi:hypothetical protein
VRNVPLRRDPVAGARGHDSEQGMLDRVHRGDRGAPLEPRQDVIDTAWAWVLTRG